MHLPPAWFMKCVYLLRVVFKLYSCTYYYSSKSYWNVHFALFMKSLYFHFIYLCFLLRFKLLIVHYSVVPIVFYFIGIPLVCPILFMWAFICILLGCLHKICTLRSIKEIWDLSDSSEYFFWHWNLEASNSYYIGYITYEWILGHARVKHSTATILF